MREFSQKHARQGSALHGAAKAYCEAVDRTMALDRRVEACCECTAPLTLRVGGANAGTRWVEGANGTCHNCTAHGGADNATALTIAERMPARAADTGNGAGSSVTALGALVCTNRTLADVDRLADLAAGDAEKAAEHKATYGLSGKGTAFAPTVEAKNAVMRGPFHANGTANDKIAATLADAALGAGKLKDFKAFLLTTGTTFQGK